MSLPIRAPLDHVMDIESMYNRNLSDQEYGPYIEFREHDFLKNPRLPIKYINSKVNVHKCESVNCEIKDHVRHTKFIPRLTETQLIDLMKDYDKVSLWHFKDLKGDLFRGFKDPARQEKFLKRMSKYSGRFCCAFGAPDPNDAYYDMQHDIIPHVDKWGRKFEGPWRFATGWLSFNESDKKHREFERKKQDEAKNKAGKLSKI